MNYLFDTNHASQLLRNGHGLRARLAERSRDAVALCTPGLAELYYMAFNSERVAKNLTRVAALADSFPVIAFDADAAKECGQIQVELRRSGRPIPVIDMQIAAIARTHDLTVLTADRHFQRVAGLRIENWLE